MLELAWMVSLFPRWTADGFVVCCKHPIMADMSIGGEKKSEMGWF